MSKILILGDTHFGARGDSLKFLKHFEKFYAEVVFPYIDQNNIQHLIQLGDLFDRRKFINFNTLVEAKRFFFDELKKRPIQFYTLLGNHDIFWKESLSVSSTGSILGEYNFTLIDKPSTIEISGTTFDLIPWICKENEQDVFNFIDNSKSDICCGHFEIAGFPMYRGMHAEEGLSHDMFAKYERVWSGHYHTRSKAENIEYVGTPYEMTWQDAGDPKGFSIFDTETRELTFIQNPFIIHEKIEYNDKGQDPVDLTKTDIKDKYVKLVVINKTDLYKFDRFVNQLYEQQPYEVKIIEDLSEFNEGTIDAEINLEDTLSILSNYIDSIQTDGDKEAIKSVLKGLYMEAINLEVV